MRVNGPGGSSDVIAADRYTFTAPTNILTATEALVPGGPLLTPARPAISGFSESASHWRRGRSLPHIARAPVGTTFSFGLNEPANVTLTFTQSVPGRRARGRCVGPSHSNSGRPRCKRTVIAGSFAVSGHAAANKVRFQGKLSGSKTLKPGSYRVSTTARDANGFKAVSRSLSFTIVS